VLCSSINAMLPVSGQVDYSAANAFMDAFAQQHQAAGSPHYISINWGTWQQVGMAVNTPVPAQLREARAESLRHGILPAEGQIAFRRILAHTMAQVIVSPVDFAAQLKQANAAPSVEGLRAADSAPETRSDTTSGAGGLHPRPNLRTAFVEPHTELERTVAGIWQNLLGIQPIGLHDNFFELGGHSLLATQVVSRLRDVLRVELPLRSLFEATTVAELAEQLETILWVGRDQPTAVSSAADREEIEL
jgi:acyl carrier protein